MGSVFSPYYAAARRRGAPDPLDHCALNVALYRGGSKRWALTERGRPALVRDADSLCIGPSALSWDGSALTARVEEIGVPLPSRIRGRIRVVPEAWFDRSFALDAGEQHRWWPVAPCARVEVELSRPALRWSGRGYWDANWGARPLEEGFPRWSWSRSALARGEAAVLYDVERPDGASLSLALRFGPDGSLDRFDPPPAARLAPGAIWRVPRTTRADGGHAAVRRTLEDTPFYTRSVVEAALLGQPVEAVHESLSLERFRQRWVQWLLPFRMPRRAAGPPPGGSR